MTACALVKRALVTAAPASSRLWPPRPGSPRSMPWRLRCSRPPSTPGTWPAPRTCTWPPAASVRCPVAHKRAWLEYRPRGVAGVISPWNFPFFLSFQPALTALAAGCGGRCSTRPAPPPSGLRPTVEAASFPGSPVEASRACPASAWVLRRGVHVVSFTGSSAVGRELGRPGGGAPGAHPPGTGGQAPDGRRRRLRCAAGVGGDLGRIPQRRPGLCRGRAGYVGAEAYDAFVAALRAAVAEVEASSHPARGIGLVGPGQLDAVEAQVAAASPPVRHLAGREAGGGARLRAHGPPRGGPLHGGDARGDLRPGPAGDAGGRRGGGDRPGQRLSLRPARLGVGRGRRRRAARCGCGRGPWRSTTP